MRSNPLDVLVSCGVPWERTHYYAEGIRRGGTLVIVRPTDNLVVRAVQIIQRHGPVDLDQRAREWRQSGWLHFDARATPFTKAEIERERDYTRNDENRLVQRRA